MDPPERNNPLGKWQHRPDGWLRGDWRFVLFFSENYARAAERQRFGPNWCSPLSIAAKPGGLSQIWDGYGKAVSAPSSQRCWMMLLVPLRNGWKKSYQAHWDWECLVPYRYLDMNQHWHALKATVPLLGCHPKRKRFILTLNSVLGKEKTLVHTKLWFQVTWTKEDESYKMRQLSWRTQQGCVWWELKSSPVLQKPLVVPCLCEQCMVVQRGSQLQPLLLSLGVIKILGRSESSFLFQYIFLK